MNTVIKKYILKYDIVEIVRKNAKIYVRREYSNTPLRSMDYFGIYHCCQ